MKYFFSDISFMILHPLITFADGENDGLCPVESAKWGDYKGVNILDFYMNIIKHLSERGL